MNQILLKNRIITALDINPIQYRNLIRNFFELWATNLAYKQSILLENITTNSLVWRWFIEQYLIIEQNFYKENKEYIDARLNNHILNDVLVLMASEIDQYYPDFLLKNISYE